MAELQRRGGTVKLQRREGDGSYKEERVTETAKEKGGWQNCKGKKGGGWKLQRGDSVGRVLRKEPKIAASFHYSQ